MFKIGKDKKGQDEDSNFIDRLRKMKFARVMRVVKECSVSEVTYKSMI